LELHLNLKKKKKKKTRPSFSLPTLQREKWTLNIRGIKTWNATTTVVFHSSCKRYAISDKINY